MKLRLIYFTLVGCWILPLLQAGHPIPFEIKLLTVDANEGCDIADFDGDGKLDISAGRNWYRNGDWIPRPVRSIEDRAGYVRSNSEWAYDVNKDGLPDVIAMDFVGSEVYWYENPGKEVLEQGYMWPKHLLADTGWASNEVSYLVDIDKNGIPEWHSNQWIKNTPTMIFSFSTEEREIEIVKGKNTLLEKRSMPTLVGHEIGSINGHGVGFGDINNDGRDDLLFGEGWYEHPKKNPFASEWIYHPDWSIKHSACPMIVKDFDGDGLNDVINSAAHGYGLNFWRSLGPDAEGKIQFDIQLIDDSVSQLHCLVLADLDGDGSEELITGKRIRAHNGRDPGGMEPPGMYYYVWNQNKKVFKRYTIDFGNVGAGLQIRTPDIDADGDIDIVVAGKEGTQILFNKRIN